MEMRKMEMENTTIKLYQFKRHENSCGIIFHLKKFFLSHNYDLLNGNFFALNIFISIFIFREITKTKTNRNDKQKVLLFNLFYQKMSCRSFTNLNNVEDA